MKPLFVCLLSIAALAQSPGTCYNDSDDQNTRICEFSNDGARTDTVIGSYHAFHIYAAQQWKVKKASIERMRKSAVTDTCLNSGLYLPWIRL